MLCWSGSMIFVRDAAGVAPPIAISFFRCFVAMAILYPICRRSLHAQWPLLLHHWKKVALLGTLLFLGGNGILFIGLQFTTAVNAALINSAQPVVIVAIAWAMYRDRLKPVQWAGVLISFCGVAYLIGRGDARVLFGLQLNAGDVAVLCSIVAWSFYAILMRHIPYDLDRAVLLFGILGAGALSLLPAWIVEHVWFAPTRLNWALLGLTAYNAFFASVLAMFWWNHALQHMGANRAGLLIHLVPVYTVILAVTFLGERLYLFHAVGIAMIAMGIYLTTMMTGRRRRTE